MAIEGVDYADARPSPAALVAAGKRFVVRYGGPGRDSKQLHAAELAGLLGAGLSVVANAEGAAGGYRGAAAGRAWAASADQHFRALGMPPDRPIYFSVDWAAGPGDWAQIDAALRGSADVIGAARVGVYGGYATIAHCAAAKTARWLWQTYGWSAGLWWPGAHMQQYRNGVSVAGGDCDLNRALVDDFGQWGQETDMPLTPDDTTAIADAVWAKLLHNYYSGVDQPAGVLLGYAPSATGAASYVDTKLAPRFAALGQALTSLAASVADDATHEEIAALTAAVGQVDDQVIAALAGRSDADVAAALKAALGDRAADVGRLLAGA